MRALRPRPTPRSRDRTTCVIRSIGSGGRDVCRQGGQAPSCRSSISPAILHRRTPQRPGHAGVRGPAVAGHDSRHLPGRRRAVAFRRSLPARNRHLPEQVAPIQLTATATRAGHHADQAPAGGTVKQSASDRRHPSCRARDARRVQDPGSATTAGAGRRRPGWRRADVGPSASRAGKTMLAKTMLGSTHRCRWQVDRGRCRRVDHGSHRRRTPRRADDLPEPRLAQSQLTVRRSQRSVTKLTAGWCRRRQGVTSGRLVAARSVTSTQPFHRRRRRSRRCRRRRRAPRGIRPRGGRARECDEPVRQRQPVCCRCSTH